MKIKIDNKEYALDTNRAVELGVLREVKPIVLTLTEQQAEALLRVLGKVGGCPDSTPRSHIHYVWHFLHNLNLPETEISKKFNLDTMDNGLYYVPIKD